MCLTEFCGSSDYCNKCINNPNGKKKVNRNILRPIKKGEGSCLDCDYGTSLLGGGKNAVCLHTGKKNINELVRCNEWKKQK